MATFLSVVAVALIFAFDLHHLLIRAIADSYTLFRPGGGLPTGDFAALAVKVVAESFLVAIQLAAPFLVFGLVFYVGLGILSRLMPQVQIFFVAMPANILLGFVILMLLMGSIGLVFAKSPPDAGAPVDAYAVDHSATLVALDPHGRMAGIVQPPLDAAAIASDLTSPNVLTITTSVVRTSKKHM